MTPEKTKNKPPSTTATAKKRRRTSTSTTITAKSSTPKKNTPKTKTKPTKKGTTPSTNNVIGIALPPTRTLLVDNGGDTIKYGWMNNDNPPQSLPNVSARLMHQFTTLVGDELDRVQNPNSLMAQIRSTERGMICNLENQTRVWKRMLDLLGVLVPTHTDTAKCLGWKVKNGSSTTGSNKKAAAAAKKKAVSAAAAAGGNNEGFIVPEKTIPTHSMAIILLLPPHCPRILLDQIFHIWMEDFGVSYIGLGISSVCASYDQTLRTPWKTSCTVDLGWSSTLIVPTFKDKLIEGKKEERRGADDVAEKKKIISTIRRIPLGGRHMINMLKYYMSYRQYNLMDQELLMRDVFERLSYVSMDMEEDLKIARLKPSGRRLYDRDFVLPDYTNTSKGKIRFPFALQKELEMEEQRKKKQQLQEIDEDIDDDEEDEEEEDEDFEEEDDDGDDDDDDDDDDEDFEEDMKEKPTTNKKRTKEKNGHKKRKRDTDDDDNCDSNNNNNNNNDDDDDEEESMEEKRKRLLQQRAEEQRRKREQQEEEQVLRVSVERFVIPEVLFRPIDAGLQSDLMGLSHAIVQSVESCPEPYRPALYRSVYLVGGVTLLPNLMERLQRELRSLVPTEYDLKIFTADSPIDRAWLGAKAFFDQVPYTKWSVSRQEWENVSKRKAYNKLLIENGGCYV
jgi:actin-related protein